MLIIGIVHKTSDHCITQYGHCLSQCIDKPIGLTPFASNAGYYKTLLYCTTRDYQTMMQSSSSARPLTIQSAEEAKERVLQSSKQSNRARQPRATRTMTTTTTTTTSGRSGGEDATAAAAAESVGTKQYFGSTATVRSLSALAEDRPTDKGGPKGNTSRNDVSSSRPNIKNKPSSRGEHSTASSRQSRGSSKGHVSATPSTSSLLSATTRRSSSQIVADSLKATSHQRSYMHPRLQLHEIDQGGGSAHGGTNQRRSGQRSLSDGANIDEPSADASASFTSRRSTSHSAVMALTRQYELIGLAEGEQAEQVGASDSDRALSGGDDETVQASGNSSSRAALHVVTTTAAATRNSIRVAEIQDNIEIMDNEIEMTMQKLRKLQESRKVLEDELAAASRNTSGPVVPGEVAFSSSDYMYSSSSSRRSGNKTGGSSKSGRDGSSRSARPTKEETSLWKEKESTMRPNSLALRTQEDEADDNLVQNQVHSRVA